MLYYFISLQDKQWEIVDFSKNRIDQFKRTIPLISDLRNPAMRDRYREEGVLFTVLTYWKTLY